MNATKHVCWKEAKVLQINRTPPIKNIRNLAHSGRPSDQANQAGHFSHLHSRYRSRSQKTASLYGVDYMGKLYFYVGTVQRICPFSDDFHSDSALILTISVKQCMDVGARPHVCGVLNVFSIYLHSGRCFMWCLVYMSYTVLVLLSGNKDYLCRLGSTE
jgi:hypothetical protein